MNYPGEGRAGANLMSGTEKSTTFRVAPAATETNEIRRVLTKLGGPWHLARTGLWAGRTFRDLDDAVAAVERANQQHCIYFLANTPKAGQLRGRRRESDIASVNSVFLDIDNTDSDLVADLMDRLDWPPTYVAFTGGGYQAMWRLSEPTQPEDGKRISLWLQSEFEDWSPDSTQSVDHLFRLPGTRNRKSGRNAALVRLVHENWDSVLPLAEAGRVDFVPRRDGIALDLDVIELTDADLSEILAPWCRRLLTEATDANGDSFPSRSEHQWAFIGACLRDRMSAELIAGILMDDRHPVSHRTHWVKRRGRLVRRRNPMRWLERQISSHPEYGHE